MGFATELHGLLIEFLRKTMVPKNKVFWNPRVLFCFPTSLDDQITKSRRVLFVACGSSIPFTLHVV